MMNLNLEKNYLYAEGQWKTYRYDIFEDGVKVGDATVVEPPEDGNDETYLEYIEIKKEFRNKGIGSEAIKDIANKYWFLFFAALDENSARLYDRIANHYEVNTPEIDQGYGVYYIN